MAERARPDDPGFQHAWQFCVRARFIPWIEVKRNPYRDAFYARYKWASQYCKGRDVLDIPCGMGWGTSLLAGCRTLTGVDISSEAISEAQDRYGKKATFQVGNMANVGFDRNSFDVVVCLEGIEHVPADVGEVFLSEAGRVLRPGGRLLLTSPHCPTKQHSGNPYHLKEYRPKELRALLEKHFDVVEVDVRHVKNLIVSYFHASRREKCVPDGREQD